MDSRSHRGGEGGLLDEASLRRRWLGTKHFFNGGSIILNQLGFGKGSLADDEVEVGVLINAEFNLSALDVFNGLPRQW